MWRNLSRNSSVLKFSELASQFLNFMKICKCYDRTLLILAKSSCFSSRYDGQTETRKERKVSSLLPFSLSSVFFFVFALFFSFACALYIMEPRHGLKVDVAPSN